MELTLRMSRSRLFVLVEAFERDMRDLIEQYLLDHQSERDVLGAEFDKADRLRAAESAVDQSPIVHYLYTRQAFDVLMRHKQLLPGDLADQLRQNAARIDEIIPIRNRVMHGRPLRSGDFDSAVSILGGFQSRYWSATRETVARLEDDVQWEPPLETAIPVENVLHNLPLADYDDTGLVGRSEELQQLKALVKRGREHVITITGEGGIGKTALALETAYALVDDPEANFDCVLWVSLKSETLTHSGVRVIRDAVHDIAGAARHLGSAIDEDLDGTIESLAEALSGLRSLIVIDNLESAQGDDVLRLYDALPDGVTFLFTSRIGIGQIERRVPLGPLKNKDALVLFKKLSAARAPRLARLTSTATDQVLEQLRNSPLAIRWYIYSVEVGKEPVSTLRDQRELLAFCVQNVFDSLSDVAQSALTVIDAVGRSVSFDELAVLTDLGIDDLRRAAQELARGSLVIHEPDPDGGLVSRLGLTAAARMFLRDRPDRMGVLSRIREREESFRRGAERRRVEGSNRTLGPNYVRTRSAEHEPVVHLLDLALAQSKKGNAAAAEAQLERARSINAEYWEVERVAGFIASTQRRNEDALVHYRAALANCETAEDRAVVAHFLGGHLARAMHDIEGGISYAQEAHEVLGTTDTAIALGNLRVWNREYEAGQALLEAILDDVSGKPYLIAMTSLVESWRRWSEEALAERNLVDAAEKGYTGFVMGTKATGEGYTDLKLASEMLESAVASLRGMTGLGGVIDDTKVERFASWCAEHSEVVRSARSWHHFVSALGLLPQEQRVQFADVVSSSAIKDEAKLGTIVSWGGKFGFIKHDSYPNNVFFHRGQLSATDAEKLVIGSTVRFEVGEAEDGRTRAETLKVL